MACVLPCCDCGAPPWEYELRLDIVLFPSEGTALDLEPVAGRQMKCSQRDSKRNGVAFSVRAAKFQNSAASQISSLTFLRVWNPLPSTAVVPCIQNVEPMRGPLGSYFDL